DCGLGAPGDAPRRGDVPVRGADHAGAAPGGAVENHLLPDVEAGGAGDGRGVVGHAHHRGTTPEHDDDETYHGTRDTEGGVRMTDGGRRLSREERRVQLVAVGLRMM